MPELVPSTLHAVIERCAAGAIPANVALMRIHMESPSPAFADAVVNALPAIAVTHRPAEAGRISAIAALHERHPDAWLTIRHVLDLVAHDDREDPDRLARRFDAAARVAPEAGVALYALGDSDLLAAATSEVVSRLKDWNLVARDRVILDIGCGIGRLAAPLAAEGGRVIGVDVSSEMLIAARRRAPGALFVRTSGRDLACFADAAIDLVLAVDSFPYLFQAGIDLVERHLFEAGRVMRRGGALLILNFSYRADADADGREATALAKGAGLVPVRLGERPFTLWDGAAYQFTKQ